MTEPQVLHYEVVPRLVAASLAANADRASGARPKAKPHQPKGKAERSPPCPSKGGEAAPKKYGPAEPVRNF